MKCSTAFFLHRWTKWHIIDRGEICRSDTKAVIGCALVQQRECERCGYTQIDKKTVFTVSP